MLRTSSGGAEGVLRGSIRETPLRGTLLKPTDGSLKRDLIERVYMPKSPPNPNSWYRTATVQSTVYGFISLSPKP